MTEIVVRVGDDGVSFTVSPLCSGSLRDFRGPDRSRESLIVSFLQLKRATSRFLSSGLRSWGRFRYSSLLASSNCESGCCPMVVVKVPTEITMIGHGCVFDAHNASLMLAITNWYSRPRFNTLALFRGTRSPLSCVALTHAQTESALVQPYSALRVIGRRIEGAG